MSQKNLLPLIVGCIVGCTSGQAKVGEQTAPVKVGIHYWLVVGTLDDDDRQLTDDDYLALTGSDVGGQLTVFVNESPLKIVCSGRAWRITELIEYGHNSVELRGSHSERLFVKVLSTSSSEFSASEPLTDLKCLVKAAMNVNERTCQLKFDATVPFAPPFDLISNNFDSTQALDNELKQLFARFYVGLHDRSIDTVRQLFGREVDLPWNGPSGRREIHEFREAYFGRLGAALESSGFRVTNKPEAIRFVVGRRTVFAYAGIGEGPFPGNKEPYLFELSVDGTRKTIVGCRIVRQHGQWCEW